MSLSRFSVVIWFALAMMFVGFLAGYYQGTTHDWGNNGWLCFPVILAIIAVMSSGFSLLDD